MDPGTVEAITVMEKQMAQINQRLDVLERGDTSMNAVVAQLNATLVKLEQAAQSFAKELGK